MAGFQRIQKVCFSDVSDLEMKQILENNSFSASTGLNLKCPVTTDNDDRIANVKNIMQLVMETFVKNINSESAISFPYSD